MGSASGGKVHEMQANNDAASPEFHLDQALVAFAEAVELTDGDERPGTYGVILHDIAEVHEIAGRVDDALDHYRRAAAFKRRGDNPADLGITLADLASCLIDHGDLCEALTILDEASEVLSRPGVDLSTRSRATRIYELGRLYERLGGRDEDVGYERALSSYRWALELVNRNAEPRSYGAVLRSIGDVQRAQGRLLEATESFSSAVAVFRACCDPISLVSVLIALGRAHRKLATNPPTPRTVESVVPPEGDAVDA